MIPIEFKPNTFYWVESESGSAMPLLLNVDMKWKVGEHFIPHKSFIAMLNGKRVVEAVPPW